MVGYECVVAKECVYEREDICVDGCYVCMREREHVDECI